MHSDPRYYGEWRKQIPVYSNALKDVPVSLRMHDWIEPIKYDQLQKYQLKVRMCCPKCEEKVKEEIWEVPGVFEVKATWTSKKVVVVVMPEFPDRSLTFEKDVLRKAQKIDCRAKFVDLDASERLKQQKPQQQQQQGGQHQQGGQGQGAQGGAQGGQGQGAQGGRGNQRDGGGQRPEGGVTHVVYPQSGSNMVIDPYYPSYQPRPHFERPYQEDYVHYFYFLLLALFVSMLILR